MTRSADESANFRSGDTDLTERCFEPFPGDRYECRHAPRQPQNLQEINPAGEAGSQGQGVRIDDDRNAGALLPYQK